MQNQSGTGKDPMSQLDAAMSETFQELERQGSGVSPSDVSRETPREAPRQERPRRQERRQERRPARASEEAPREGDGTWLDEGEAAAEPRPRPAPRRRAPKDDAASVILDEADQDEDAARPQERAPSRRRAQDDDGAPQRGPDGRFLPSRADTDADDDDDDLDEDDDDAVADGRRYAESEEADVDDDDVEPEGRRRAEDDEDEDDATRRDGQRRRRIPRAMQREIDKRVESRVSKVIEERDQLRQAQAQHQQVEAQAIDTLIKAIGTQEERDKLQQVVNNPRVPLEQRNRAAATLNRYVSNEKYVRTYRTALLAADRQEKVGRRTEAITHLAKYQIELDPGIVHAGDDANTMAHVARQAILAERKRGAAEVEKLKRQLATRGGYADERVVRNGRFGRDSLASANGRRANGRVATVDPLRRAMGYDRGLGSASQQVPMPTDEVLRQLRDGEVTLRELGLDQ